MVSSVCRNNALYMAFDMTGGVVLFIVVGEDFMSEDGGSEMRVGGSPQQRGVERVLTKKKYSSRVFRRLYVAGYIRTEFPFPGRGSLREGQAG